MGNILFTSDFHFNHDREFIWKKRGFDSVYEMNRYIVSCYNQVVSADDDVYILGDLMFGGPERLEDGLKLIKQLKGHLHIVRGNHDTDTRWKAYGDLYNVVEMENSIYLDYNGYHLYLSHYPSITGNLERDDLKKMTLNIFGHTHQTSIFYEDMPFMYHCGVDSHACFPVGIEVIISDMNRKIRECKGYL